jgi:hypothetical protein
MMRALVPLIVLFGAAAAILSALGSTVWVVLLTDGVLPVVLIAAAYGWGAWPTAWLGHRGRDPLPQSCIAAALGLGIVGVLTLVAGVTGLLARSTAWGMIAIGCGLGAARLYVARRTRTDKTLSPVLSLGGKGTVVAGALLLLPLAVPLAVALFGACLPPGVLWNGEARGYDVLEYHLEVPREYFDAGRITFLPHNVYASFPQQVEILYLLLMYLAGGPLAAAIPAQLLHVALGILTVVALMAWTPPGWPRLIVAVAAGSVPWLAYLGCLAYVELGVLFFAAVAGGLVVWGARPPSRSLENRPSAGDSGVGYYLSAGLCAGLAGGCKYTALALIGAALAVTLLCLVTGAFRVRLRRLGWFLAGLIVAFSPWLIRNAAFTGNPVYPFAYRWFDGAAWSAAQDEQWARGTGLPAEDRPIRRRLAITWDELPASAMFGAGLFLLALAGLVLIPLSRKEGVGGGVEPGAQKSPLPALPLRGGGRSAAALGLWCVLILLGWAAFTRMPGRFAVPIVVPVALLIGIGAGAAQRQLRPPRWRLIVLGCLALASAAINGRTLARALYRNDRLWASYGAPLRMLLGATEGFAREQPLTNLLPAAGRVWLVGEARAFYLPARVHYTVVFDRDPWLEFARSATAADSIAWLRTHSVAYVVFCWPEIDRLKGSYGFPTWVTRRWVESLVPAGLRRIDLMGEPAGRDIDVYEVLPR